MSINTVTSQARGSKFRNKNKKSRFLGVSRHEFGTFISSPVVEPTCPEGAKVSHPILENVH